MKNILLLGDSIRIGYDKSVKASMKNIANVISPEDNCRFASYLLRYIQEYKRELIPDGNVDIIHWNAGLWDCLRMFGEEPHTPVEIYAYYIDRICQRIGKLMPEAKVIFALSTSVQSERMSANFKRYNEEIERYNAAAEDVVRKYGFEVNDLYAVSQELPPEAHSDAVHYYTPMGTEAFANKVISHLLPALGVQEKVVYKEALHTDKPIGI